MNNLLNHLKHEAEYTRKFFTDGDRPEDYDPQTYGDNRMYDAGYIAGIEQAIFALDAQRPYNELRAMVRDLIELIEDNATELWPEDLREPKACILKGDKIPEQIELIKTKYL